MVWGTCLPNRFEKVPHIPLKKEGLYPCSHPLIIQSAAPVRTTEPKPRLFFLLFCLCCSLCCIYAPSLQHKPIPQLPAKVYNYRAACSLCQRGNSYSFIETPSSRIVFCLTAFLLRIYRFNSVFPVLTSSDSL